jgi:ankyrin repeat protein
MRMTYVCISYENRGPDFTRFLLARLHLDSLIAEAAPKRFLAALQNLPIGADAYNRAYDYAMDRINMQFPGQVELAKQVLSWLTCARRALSIIELQHALAVRVGELKFDEANITRIEDMVPICAGLITVDEQNNTIGLVHYTTQKYFESTLTQHFPTAEFDITAICVTYLSFIVFGSGFCHTDSCYEERLQLYPLYEYAACYWGHPARQASTLHERIIDFLECESKVEAATQAMLARKRYPSHFNYSQEVPRQMTGLHLAAYFGLTEPFEVILRSSDVESMDTWGRTPLSLAAAGGHEAVVKQLLEAKADVESKDTDGRTPLSRAAAGGHEAVVKQLLEAKADVESKDTDGRTPLSWAAAGGHEAVVKHLLEAKADVKSTNTKRTTPLSWAAERGHEAVVKELLEAKADVKSKDRWGRTPLSRAAAGGHEAVVKQLLEAKADVKSKDRWGRTPLLWAAERGHEAVVKQLLEAKADVESMDTDGQTPLSWAAEGGHEAVVKQLLEAKADVESMDRWGRTPLSRAAVEGHEAVVKQLLEAKADVESKDRWGRTPLSWAAEGGHEAVVKELLEAKADVKSKDTDSRTPLLWAAERGHEAVVKLLQSTTTTTSHSSPPHHPPSHLPTPFI